MNGILQIALYCAVLLSTAYPMGVYMHRVFEGERTFLSPVLAPVEKLFYRLCGVSPKSDMRWTTYATTLLLFNAAGFAILFLFLRTQAWHPHLLNPQGMPGMSPTFAMGTAVSFVTNTNWQAYSGESAATYASQMFGLTWQNFVSAATGMAAAVALMRGLTRKKAQGIGNFWADLVRATIYILLPISVVLAVVFCAEGVVQNLNPYTTAHTIEGGTQTLAQGPAASQLAIKMLGTNGGGFFNASSAHPYENPTPLSNFLQMLAIFLIPSGLTVTFGRYARNRAQGWALWSAMFLLFVAGTAAVYWSEQAGNPILSQLGANQQAVAAPGNRMQAGGNMEGKEVRFGIANSALFAAVTTDASCGAVNSMHDSYTPLGGMIPMLNIALGEMIFGGVGAGMLGILLYAVLTVFIAGLMVGRTPEYLGKKVEAKEMKMAMAAVLVVVTSILVGAAIGVSTEAGLAARTNQGPHGLSEIFYAAASATGNNGSAFAGLSANSHFYNILLALCMLAGRFLFIIPLLALAGSMAGKNTVPESNGTFSTTGPLFVFLLIGVILIVGALTFVPVLALGPIIEHFAMTAGEVF